MPSMDGIDPSLIYGLFKGIPGTRKSTHALSMPGPQYWFSVDQKMQALIRPMRDWGIKPADVEYDDYKDYNSMQKKMEQLQVNCKYKTLIFDSITSIGDVTNRQTMRSKAGTTNQQGQEKGLRVGGIPVNSLEDYKAEASAFSEIISVSKDIASYHRVNIILIAHVIGEKKELGAAGEHWTRIICTGGKIISAKIPAYCTEVYHFEYEGSMIADQGGELVVNTQDTGYDFARTIYDVSAKIKPGNQPLYKTYIKPAIDRLTKPVGTL